MTSAIDAVLVQLTGQQDLPPSADEEALAAEAAGAAEIKPVYPHADEWVRNVFVLLGEYKRQTVQGRGDGLRWCPRWWAPPLALDRLESLWRAWKALRLDPGTGLSVWYRDQFAPALADLTDADGPFRQCGPERHVDPEAALALPAPEAILVHFADKAPPVSAKAD